jgi:hypothetical protein
LKTANAANSNFFLDVLTLVEDPFRTVLFQDIEKYLFDIHDPENKILLINAFISLLYRHGDADLLPFSSNDSLRNDTVLISMNSLSSSRHAIQKCEISSSMNQVRCGNPSFESNAINAMEETLEGSVPLLFEIIQQSVEILDDEAKSTSLRLTLENAVDRKM